MPLGSWTSLGAENQPDSVADSSDPTGSSSTTDPEACATTEEPGLSNDCFSTG